MPKNYYAILGVLPSATLEEIRSAYRRHAKGYHPDRFGHDSAPFLNVQEAYEVLSDPANRASYDRKWRERTANEVPHLRPEPEIIHSRKPPIEPLRSRRPANLETISPLDSFHTSRPSFDELLDNLQNALDVPTQRKGDRFETLTMEVVLTPDEAGSGGKFQLLLPIEATCPACGGSGDLGDWDCWRCNGTGAIREEFPIEVEYPPGILDHYQVAIPLDRVSVPDICVILLFRISSY